MEITPEQWTELNEQVARIDSRLTSQEAQTAYHNKLLVTDAGSVRIDAQVYIS